MKENLKKKSISQEFNFSAWYFSPRKVTKILLTAIALLIIFYILEEIFLNILEDITNTKFTAKYFVFDSEHNFPTFYSALTLGFASYLLSIIAKFEKFLKSKFAKFWRALSFIFLYLAIDEAVTIHEHSIEPLRNALSASGFFFFTWIIPAFILLIVLFLIFKDFIYNLPTKTRNLFLLAGTVYVSGALGLESIGGYIGDVISFNTRAYWLVLIAKELLEMLGVVIFIYSLLSYIKNHITTPVKFHRLKNEYLKQQV
ncbi:hypothetical protein Sta7437_0489 [Stanieria cyanosphaera PCC 7437]|uniref:Uncharacterized protein n=1 Tax=Stanieria cyanosphaera (strain ATCC 29371 / PCC 7437) TaxID=111780 RepID=K9XPY3_STAC7|nr:hypothetical protein [Stanieria cyanosphaera]AFZ34096.1 hypothetical protein Sta7437_0489 [Stanieria cyanosphaera PCC 7437]